MRNPLSGRVSAEYTPKGGVHFPETSHRGRAIQPSYSSGVSNTVTHLEPVTISIPVPSIAANGSVTVTGKQQLQRSSLNLAPTDTASLVVTNLSVSAPANVIASHPTVTIISNQGTPVGGVLAAGQGYQNLSLSASVPCYSIPGSPGGTLTIKATLLIVGTSTG